MKAIENMIGKYVIVRSSRAGVFFGILSEYENGTAVLSECRNIWYWDGANCLADLAEYGVTKPRNCKFSIPVDEVVVNEVTQLLPCGDEAIENIKAVPEWKM